MTDHIVPHIRWMIRRDMAEVRDIESRCFEYPWTSEDFISYLRQRNCIGIVAEHNEQVVGYSVYELHQSRLDVLNFAVHPEFQRRGIGRAMLANLVGRLSWQRRSKLTLHVRETNLSAQKFFAACGMRAVQVVQDVYSDTDEAAYRFERRVTSNNKGVPCST